MTQRVLVVDDNRGITSLVRTYLEKSDFEVLVAHDGETALRMLRHERPQLVLVDLILSGRNGREITQEERSDMNLAAMPVIMLATPVERQNEVEPGNHSETVFRQPNSAAPEAGADNFGTKAFNPHKVVAGVQAVLRRAQREPIRSQVVEVGQLKVNLAARRVEVDGRSVHLTPTEFGLLRALAEHPGHALTRQEMIEKGLGHGYNGLERTVDSHVKNLRQKLDEAGAASYLVETVFGIGYRLAPGDSAGYA